jgi:hypothetical protein
VRGLALKNVALRVSAVAPLPDKMRRIVPVSRALAARSPTETAFCRQFGVLAALPRRSHACRRHPRPRHHARPPPTSRSPTSAPSSAAPSSPMTVPCVRTTQAGAISHGSPRRRGATPKTMGNENGAMRQPGGTRNRRTHGDHHRRRRSAQTRAGGVAATPAQGGRSRNKRRSRGSRATSARPSATRSNPDSSMVRWWRILGFAERY